MSWIFAVMLAAGCADEPTGSASPIATLPASERWTLTRIDGQPLPVSYPQTQSVVREVTAGRLTVDSDWTWTFRFDHHDTGPGVDREASSGITGVYTLYGGEPAVMGLNDGETGASYTGSVAMGSVLDVTMQGHNYRFTRAL